MADTIEQVDIVLTELRACFARMADDAVPVLAEAIQRAGRVAVYGVGRNGLALQGFTMRLAHLGLQAAYVGQLAAPPIGKGDLFLAAAALGRLPTADALAAQARAAGAHIAVITARPDAVEGADVTVDLPAQTMADPPTGLLPLGSGFELALWLFCDLVVVELMRRLGQSNDDLAGRHANLL
jgi:6-phospho-3-hexuloisomerase